MIRENLGETLLGAAVLAAAGGFLAYAVGVTGETGAGGGYQLAARFGQVGGLEQGADVRVAGVRVGSVTSVELDRKTYLALARLKLDPSLRLPADSTARISADGLLGGAHVAIEPGGASETLKAGGEIENTQGAVDLFGLIGRSVRPNSTPGDTAQPGA